MALDDLLRPFKKTKTWDAKRVVSTVGGAIITGYADGTFVTAERNEDSFTLQPGTEGQNTRTYNPNKSGRIAFTLMQHSESNQMLEALSRLDEKTGGGCAYVRVRDIDGSALASGNGWLVKPAAVELAMEAGVREWIFEIDELALSEDE